MLVPQRSYAPLPPISQINEQTNSHKKVTARVEVGTADALEPLKVPPRPGTSALNASEPLPVATAPRLEEDTGPNKKQDGPPPDPPFQPRLFLTNLREGISLIVGGVGRYIQNEEISTARKVVTLGGTTVTVLGAFTYGMAHGLGALSLVLAKLSDNLPDNKHSRAYATVSASAQSTHFVARGDDALANNSEMFVVRMLLQSMIPESRTGLTLAVTTVGVALSSYLFCSSSAFVPEISLRNAPLLATVLHGFAGALPTERSAVTRMANLVCSSLMLPFHCLVSGSVFLAALSGIYLYGTIKMIRERDLPTLMAKGRTTASGTTAHEPPNT